MLSKFLSLLSRRPAPLPIAERPAANENMPLMDDDDDPWAVLIVVREVLADWRRANARDGRLLHCPDSRRQWDDIKALERAVL